MCWKIGKNLFLSIFCFKQEVPIKIAIAGNKFQGLNAS